MKKINKSYFSMEEAYHYHKPSKSDGLIHLDANHGGQDYLDTPTARAMFKKEGWKNKLTTSDATNVLKNWKKSKTISGSQYKELNTNLGKKFLLTSDTPGIKNYGETWKFDKSYSPSRKNQFSDLKNFNGQSSTAPFKKVKSYVKFASEPNEYLLTEHWKNFKNKNKN